MSPDPEVDLVDRIAQDLPMEVRAAYYRELNHCRSLPENDEMLRILRAMQFLTLLMRQVPDQVTVERARIEALFGQAVEELRGFAERAGEYRSAIEDRLMELPTAVVEGLRPELVAREINESLRQQFAASTIPQTAHAMTVAAAEMKAAVAGFTRVAAAVNDEHRSMAAQTRITIEHLDSAVSQAARTAQHAAEQLSGAFRRELRWSIYTLVSLGAVFAFALGVLFDRWVNTPPVAPSEPDPTAISAPQKVKPRAPR
jgi:hypothetical protein